MLCKTAIQDNPKDGDPKNRQLPKKGLANQGDLLVCLWLVLSSTIPCHCRCSSPEISFVLLVGFFVKHRLCFRTMRLYINSVISVSSPAGDDT